MSIIKWVIYFIVFISISSCFTNKSIFSDIPYNEKELNLLCIFAYFKDQSITCTDDCIYTVSRELEYFDNCVVSKYAKKYEDVGSIIDSSKQIIIKSTYLIPDMGEVSFRKDDPDSWDYKFSPILYNPNEKNMFGQVVNSKGEKYWLTFNLVGDKVFLGATLRYNYFCEML